MKGKITEITLHYMAILRWKSTKANIQQLWDTALHNYLMN